MPFQPVDAALHRVALAVVDLVELRRSATAGTAFLTVADLVGFLRDGAADTTSAQVGTVRAGAVGLICPDLVRPGARSARSRAGYPDGLQDRLELRAVVPVTGGDDERERLLPLLDGQVQLGGQPAARASETVVVGLGVDAAGRLLLQCPFLRAPAACW